MLHYCRDGETASIMALAPVIPVLTVGSVEDGLALAPPTASAGNSFGARKPSSRKAIREVGREALRHPVEEIFLLRVATDIGERQDDHREARRRGFFGHREWRGGSVQRGGNRMRLNVQLIDAESGSHLWAERFEKPVTDLFGDWRANCGPMVIRFYGPG